MSILHVLKKQLPTGATPNNGMHHDGSTMLPLVLASSLLMASRRCMEEVGKDRVCKSPLPHGLYVINLNQSDYLVHVTTPLLQKVDLFQWCMTNGLKKQLLTGATLDNGNHHDGSPMLPSELASSLLNASRRCMEEAGRNGVPFVVSHRALTHRLSSHPFTRPSTCNNLSICRPMAARVPDIGR